MDAIVTQFLAYLGEHIGDAYIWGARGQCLDTIDIAAFVKKSETSTENYNRAMKFIANSTKKPLYAFDCSGLICGFLMARGLSGRVNSRTIYAKSTRIRRDELQPGDLVFRYKDKKRADGVGTYKYIYHVGVYVGNDRVIESKGRDDGVVLRGINASGPAYWNEYGRWDVISGEAKEDITKEDIPAVAKKIELTSPMMRGDDIKALQTALTALGYDAGDADGIAGKNTIAALEAFCEAHSTAKAAELPDTLQVSVDVDGKTYAGTVQ